jgi:hypothetical protein
VAVLVELHLGGFDLFRMTHALPWPARQ